MTLHCTFRDGLILRNTRYLDDGLLFLPTRGYANSGAGMIPTTPDNIALIDLMASRPSIQASLNLGVNRLIRTHLLPSGFGFAPNLWNYHFTWPIHQPIGGWSQTEIGFWQAGVYEVRPFFVTVNLFKLLDWLRTGKITRAVHIELPYSKSHRGHQTQYQVIKNFNPESNITFWVPHAH